MIFANYISDTDTDTITVLFDDYLKDTHILPVKICVFIFISTRITNIEKRGGHANAIVIDTSRRQIHHFEPNGALALESNGLWELAMEVGDYIKDMIQAKTGDEFEYFSIDRCPFIGVQAQEHYATQMTDAFMFTDRDIGGYCMAWSCMFIHYHLLNPSLSNDDIYSLLMMRFDSMELSDRIYKYAGLMMYFYNTKEIPNTHFRKMISKRDFQPVIHICQDFIREKMSKVNNIDYFSGDMKIDDEDLIEEFYRICGIKEVVRKFLSDRKMEHFLVLPIKKALGHYRMAVLQILKTFREAN